MLILGAVCTSWATGAPQDGPEPRQAVVSAGTYAPRRYVAPGAASDGVAPTATPSPSPTATPTPVPPTAAPAATPIPVIVTSPAGSCGERNVEEWRWLVAPYAWDATEALGVIRHESRGDPCVYNFEGSGACGLFQHLPCACTDLQCQVNLAWAKYVDGGYSFWRHWYQWWR